MRCFHDRLQFLDCALTAPQLPHVAGSSDREGIGMTERKVKWFNPGKGVGFIQPDNADEGVFAHITALERVGLTGLADE